MIPSNICFGLVLLFQTGVGVLANLFLLSLYSFSFLISHIGKPINLIIVHLILANIIMLLSKGGPETVIALSGENFLNDIGCKLVFFFHRVSQALSICFTCYLCNFQAIILSPPGSRWAKFKARASEHIMPFCIFCCIFNLLIEIPVIVSLTGPRTLNNRTYEFNFSHCSLLRHIDAYWILATLRNVLCIGLLLWAGGNMVFLLRRHHQQVQSIHSTILSARASPEVKATQIILQLVSTFVFFYLLSSIVSICVNHFYQHRFWLLPVNAFLNLCFPTFSPFVLIPPGTIICPGFCQGQTIHSTSLSARASPEVKAAQTVLQLVSTFLFFYLLSSIFVICNSYFY
ncbi:vomeronasal type-1 receptor 3-like [Phascolarctos cinereus]|uniref:Vomeronasal type-1 receptor n=1 Tax=Phascolarctos cinereus TaxID=38626 RepID=A0A6P5J7I4_PHACI|nr:vomeronasal type-1 receptor 3-like [Phascolarctos cinereus]